MVRAELPDLPILLQSSRSEFAAGARAVGATFLRKYSETLLADLRAFMVDYFALGDFVFRMPNGDEVARAADLRTLEEKLRTVPAASIGFHGERNHFSNWFTARTEFALARKLRPRKVNEFATLEDLRRDLISSIAEYRREQGEMLVADFDRHAFDGTAGFFARVGGGSLGGKARGLAFVQPRFPATRLLRTAIARRLLRRGLPRKLYTDQGKPFINAHTRLVCAQLAMRLLHCKPYHSWSKGKIERVIFSIQSGFESTLRLEGNQAHDLDGLNFKLSVWIQTVYHARVHSSTNESPEVRFQRAAPSLRYLDATEDIDRLFYIHLFRTVRKNGTVRLDGQLYEVPLSLRALKVQLRLDPFTRRRIEVWHQNKFIGLARKAPLNLNSETGGEQAYDR